MLVIIGKTASGKSAVARELCKKGYKQLITYTTRPRRKRESKDAYHFISDEEFAEKVAGGFFAEYRRFKTDDGDWFYGSAEEDLEDADDKTVVILDPVGFHEIQTHYELPIKSVYLYANIPTIRRRLEKRGDEKNEVDRRIASDNLLFRGLETKVNRIVYNGENDLLDDVVQKIIDFDNGRC